MKPGFVVEDASQSVWTEPETTEPTKRPSTSNPQIIYKDGYQDRLLGLNLILFGAMELRRLSARPGRDEQERQCGGLNQTQGWDIPPYLPMLMCCLEHL